MEITKRSFRAFSVAQPMKKEIDETLAKVELEKRRFLALEREQTQLKEAMERKKKELNALKLKEPENKTSLNKAAQANLVANNTDRSYQHVVNSIEQLKLGIDVHRRQIEKYKRITSKLEVDTAAAKTSNIDLQNKIKEK